MRKWVVLGADLEVSKATSTLRSCRIKVKVVEETMEEMAQESAIVWTDRADLLQFLVFAQKELYFFLSVLFVRRISSPLHPRSVH